MSAAAAGRTGLAEKWGQKNVSAVHLSAKPRSRRSLRLWVGRDRKDLTQRGEIAQLREDFSGARTALSARIRGGRETRGQGCPRSAWLRLRRAAFFVVSSFFPPSFRSVCPVFQVFHPRHLKHLPCELHGDPRIRLFPRKTRYFRGATNLALRKLACGRPQLF
jgi:hypothetical protein